MFRWMFFLLVACLLQAASHTPSPPFITGDGFRAICTFAYDAASSFDPAMVREADTVFVQTDFLDGFFKTVHPKIAKPYILVTHNSDLPVTKDFASYLKGPNIIAWFVKNATFKHPKVRPIPAGIPNLSEPFGNASLYYQWIPKIDTWVSRLSSNDRPHWVYVYLDPTSSDAGRKELIDAFQEKPFAVLGTESEESDYLAQLNQAKFFIAAPGSSLDNPRNWEALLMGAIPILLHSDVEGVYKSMPVLFVDQWSDVKAKLLKKVFHQTSCCNYPWMHLKLDTWSSQINSVRYNYWLKPYQVRPPK